MHAGASPAQQLAAAQRARLLSMPAVDRAVVEQLDAQGAVDVLIYLGDAQHAERIDAILRDLPADELSRRHRFRRVPMLAGRVTARGLARILDHEPSLRVSLDVRVEPQLDQTIPLTGIDLIHATSDTGMGIQIAVVDTGIDTDHPDLTAALVEERCFCDNANGPLGCCPNGLDTDSGPGAAEDDHGHGTRISGVLVSGGVVAPVGGAPHAELIAIKTIPASGSGNGTDMIAALDWILNERPDVTVVNMSLGGGQYTGDCDGADAFTMGLASAIDALHARGTIVVAGSGNNGWGTAMIAPACVSRAVSVGAVWDSAFGSRTEYGCTDETATDLVTCWSNASSTTDVFAPGGLMLSSTIGGGKAKYVGTSYAAPVVASCAALLQSDFPSASAEQIITALKTSPISVIDDTSGLSFPRLRCSAAYASLAPPVPMVPGRGAWLALVASVVVLGAMPKWWERRRVPSNTGAPG